MSDLISRSALIKEFEIQEFIKNDRLFDIPQIKAFIEQQPTVDAVAVIRCRDCAHWGTGLPGEIENVKCCEYAGYMICENGYCLYGERK